MALPASGTLSLSDIKTEFNGVNPIAMGSYYRGGTYVTANNTSVPTSGAISISNFYGASNTVGTTWTQATTYTNSTLSVIGVVYGNSIYVATGYALAPFANTTIMYSADGNTWTTSTALYSILGNGVFRSISFANGYFIVNDGTGTGSAAYSTNGTSWTAINIAAGGAVASYIKQAVIWDATNSRYVASNGSTLLLSTNLSAWTLSVNSGYFNYLIYASHLGKVFGVSGYNGTGSGQAQVSSTPNLTVTVATQNLVTLLGWGAGTILTGLNYSGSTLFAWGYLPGANPRIRAAKSTDGVTWTDVSSALALGTNYITSALWGGANWVFVYTDNNIWFSY
jgi:hypothetical protein